MRVIKSGNTISLYPNDLLTYDKIPAGYYAISFNQMSGWSMTDAPALEIKEKVYGVNNEKVEKVLRAFKRTNKNLGVILSGDKGIGKSLTARMIAIKAEGLGYPVIIVGSYIPGIANFINSIDQECVILMDEYDKTFGVQSKDSDTIGDPQTEMLSLFDGIASGKKLFIITCNELRGVSSYLVNRPGRFHYHFRFEYPIPEEITKYLEDHNISQEEIEKVVGFSHKVKLNYDCLHAIAFELEDGSHFEDIINDLNIININAQQYHVTIYFTDGTSLRTTERLDLFSDEEVSVEFNQHGDEWSDEIGWIAFVPSTVTYWNGTNVLLPSNCEWTLDSGVHIAAAAKPDTEDPDSRYSQAEIDDAKQWLNRKVDRVEFRLSDSSRYTYSI